MTPIEYVQTHPAVALVVTVCHVLMAEAIKEIQVPIIFMQAAQLGAWAVTITVGLITIYGFFNKKK